MAGKAKPRADGGVRMDGIAHGQRLAVQKGRATRKDGWTEAKRTAFLETLAATCNIKAAARSVRMSVAGAYALAYRDAGFRAAWRGAVGLAFTRLEMEMLHRALVGEDRMQDALANAASAEAALDLMSRHPMRLAETLWRGHRAAAADWAGEARDDGSAAVAAIEARIAAIRHAVLRGARPGAKSADAAPADGDGADGEPAA